MEVRIEKLQKALFSQRGAAQGYLITSPVARRYLLGFSSTAGTGLILEDAAYFIVDFRYYEMACHAIQGCKVLLQENLAEQVKQLCAKHHAATLGVEEQTMTLSEYDGLTQSLTGLTLVRDGKLSAAINRLRLIKDADEIQAIAAAQALSEEAYTDLLGILKEGMTEKQIALELDFRMRRLGAEDVSFETIVAAGPHSASPHAHPTDYAVQKGDLITMDFGALLNGLPRRYDPHGGYRGAGREKAASVSDGAHRPTGSPEGYGAGKRVFRHGPGGPADHRQRRVPGCFGHSLGHGVGVEIHEGPNLAPRSQGVLKEGMVVSCEPGIYLEGQYGARIEDLVAITPEGCWNLNRTSKELICL